MADLLHLVDKPEGWTSHDAVARMRGILGESRVGHAGTLDPFASGLLLVGEGRATGVLGTLALLPKRYRARARFGVTTDTQDRTGAVVARSDRIPERAEIERALDPFRGAIRQRPPAYSAVRVRGERSYEAARRGATLDREERPVTVYDLTVAGADLPDVELDVTVSRGTYVRTLAHDLGQALGCGAHLAALRRVSSGPFAVEDALSCTRDSGHDAQAFRRRAAPLERALAFLPRVRLEPEEAERLRHGGAPTIACMRVEAPAREWPLPPGEPGWPLALLAPDGRVLALARPWDQQIEALPLKLQRVLVEGA